MAKQQMPGIKLADCRTCYASTYYAKPDDSNDVRYGIYVVTKDI
jgi:hypothetical protein